MRIAKKDGMVLDNASKPETLFPLIVKTIVRDYRSVQLFTNEVGLAIVHISKKKIHVHRKIFFQRC